MPKLQFRCTDMEARSYKVSAERAGLSLSEWVRWKCGNLPSADPVTDQRCAVMEKDGTEPLAQPHPPRQTKRDTRLCSRCSRMGVATCPECRKKVANG